MHTEPGYGYHGSTENTKEQRQTAELTTPRFQTPQMNLLIPGKGLENKNQKPKAPEKWSQHPWWDYIDISPEADRWFHLNRVANWKDVRPGDRFGAIDTAWIAIFTIFGHYWVTEKKLALQKVASSSPRKKQHFLKYLFRSPSLGYRAIISKAILKPMGFSSPCQATLNAAQKQNRSFFPVFFLGKATQTPVASNNTIIICDMDKNIWNLNGLQWIKATAVPNGNKNKTLFAALFFVGRNLCDPKQHLNNLKL